MMSVLYAIRIGKKIIIILYKGVHFFLNYTFFISVLLIRFKYSVLSK